MAKYKVTRYWTVACVHEIEAESEEQAIRLTDDVRHSEAEERAMLDSAQMDDAFADEVLV